MEPRAVRLPALDGVRALAILAVLAFHVAGGRVGGGGWLGVDVFFVLSGFLITRLLLAERDRTGRVDLRRFYLRRALRLYPALLLAVLLGGVVVVAGAARRDPFPAHVLHALTYTQDLAVLRGWAGGGGLLNHTWSLAIEEHFYLVWPLVLLVVVRRGRRAVAVVAGVGAMAGYAVLVLAHGAPQGHGRLPAVYYRPDARSAALLVGCLAGCVLTCGWSRQSLRDRSTSLGDRTGTIALGVLVVLLVVAPRPEGIRAFTMAMPVVWVATAVLVLALAGGAAGPAGRLLAWRPAAYLGSISYSLYLYHPLVAGLVTHELGRADLRARVVGAAITLVVSIGLAAASYRWVERPLLRLARARPVPGPRRAGLVKDGRAPRAKQLLVVVAGRSELDVEEDLQRSLRGCPVSPPRAARSPSGPPPAVPTDQAESGTSGL